VICGPTASLSPNACTSGVSHNTPGQCPYRRHMPGAGRGRSGAAEEALHTEKGTDSTDESFRVHEMRPVAVAVPHFQRARRNRTTEPVRVFLADGRAVKGEIGLADRRKDRL